MKAGERSGCVRYMGPVRSLASGDVPRQQPSVARRLPRAPPKWSGKCRGEGRTGRPSSRSKGPSHLRDPNATSQTHDDHPGVQSLFWNGGQVPEGGWACDAPCRFVRQIHNLSVELCPSEKTIWEILMVLVLGNRGFAVCHWPIVHNAKGDGCSSVLRRRLRTVAGTLSNPLRNRYETVSPRHKTAAVQHETVRAVATARNYADETGGPPSMGR